MPRDPAPCTSACLSLSRCCCCWSQMLLVSASGAVTSTTAHLVGVLLEAAHKGCRPRFDGCLEAGWDDAGWDGRPETGWDSATAYCWSRATAEAAAAAAGGPGATRAGATAVGATRTDSTLVCQAVQEPRTHPLGRKLHIIAHLLCWSCHRC